jgi:catechol 2,3-dioxygenase-like lactoylglutathione lyase family enzyme
MAKITYYTVGSNRLEAAKAFYDALLSTIGMDKLFDHPSGGRIYGVAGDMFGVLGPHDGKAATIGNGCMGGFSLDTNEQVAAFHAKALELGAVNEGDPGERAPGAYFAYFRDLDGNKLCGFKFG